MSAARREQGCWAEPACLRRICQCSRTFCFLQATTSETGLALVTRLGSLKIQVRDAGWAWSGTSKQ
jgi:hypothetical protein